MLYNETNCPVILHSVIFYSCYKTVLSPFRKGNDFFFFFFSNGHEFFSSFIFAQFYMKSELPDEQNPLVLDHIPVQVPIIWPLHIKCGHSHDVVTWSELVVGEADSYFIYSEYME